MSRSWRGLQQGPSCFTTWGGEVTLQRHDKPFGALLFLKIVYWLKTGKVYSLHLLSLGEELLTGPDDLGSHGWRFFCPHRALRASSTEKHPLTNVRVISILGFEACHLKT